MMAASLSTLYSIDLSKNVNKILASLEAYRNIVKTKALDKFLLYF